jgi:hypothetical protein
VDWRYPLLEKVEQKLEKNCIPLLEKVQQKIYKKWSKKSRKSIAKIRKFGEKGVIVYFYFCSTFSKSGVEKVELFFIVK